MTSRTFNTPGTGSPAAMPFWRRWGGWVTGLALAGALLAMLWYLLSDTASTRREVASAPMLMLPPPPPPPPEPEKLPEPEPEKIEPVVTEIEPTPVEPVEQAKDEPAPNPSQDMGDPVTIDGAAEAGTDAFGIQAGRGGGSTGTGGGGGLGQRAYHGYVANLLQQQLSRDPSTRQLVFDDLRIDLWLDADGRITRVQLAQGTASPKTDELVLAMLRQVGSVPERPPRFITVPLRITMQGRRP